MEGYSHQLYADSFSSIGKPLFLTKSKGWLIKRQIPGTSYYDAMGPYPLFFCENWEVLFDDLDDLSDQLISVSFVLGPFSPISHEIFKQKLDVFYHYKDHYVLDTSLPFTETISKYRRRDARRAIKNGISVEIVTSPNINLNEWVDLYDNLIQRHHITGIRAFSRESFSKQISIPNTYFFKALHQGAVVGGNLYYIQDNVAYGHLLALSPKGYQLGASHAIKWVAIQHFTNKVRWINFGGSTTKNLENKDGLDMFKLGWSSTTKPSYFCGKILQPGLYHELNAISKPGFNLNWFPAYRQSEYQ